ncbi:MAG: hypothetical protein AABZ08_13405 [Planctomycetota bacterium]
MKRVIVLSTLVVGSLVGWTFAQSNIDTTVPNKHAWGENIGWTNWRDANAGVQGVNVGVLVLQGFIWGENVGWINVGDGTPGGLGGQYSNVNGNDVGVNISSDGTLHGYAWGENIGWINFDGGAMATPALPARILCATPPGQPLARLDGYVWGENVGWINLADLNPTKYVAVDAATTPVACDMNMDGFVNGNDVQPFVNAMLGGTTWQSVCSGDLEPPPDGMLDMDDVNPFVTCLLTAP